jgi:hypothetical protein
VLRRFVDRCFIDHREVRYDGHWWSRRGRRRRRAPAAPAGSQSAYKDSDDLYSPRAAWGHCAKLCTARKLPITVYIVCRT